MPKIYKTTLERFLDKVEFGKTYNDQCWRWQGSKNPYGYGRFRYSKSQNPAGVAFGEENKFTGMAHKFSYIVFNRKMIPNGLYCLHKCDNPSCVNPNHLFLGTQKDNMLDMKLKGRGNHAKGSRQWTSKLNESKSNKSGIETKLLWYE